MAELTPMMQQYRAVKEQNPDCLLFFRLGDFYEMFEDDARVASRELDLTLTTRDHAKGKSAEEKTPMCGVPYHSSESYIARLVAKGYKVAICEQMEDPALAKGLVKREVLRRAILAAARRGQCIEADSLRLCKCVIKRNDPIRRLQRCTGLRIVIEQIFEVLTISTINGIAGT